MHSNPQRRMRAPVCLFVLLAVGACIGRPQTGIMAADWTPPEDSKMADQKVTIGWQSKDGTRGSMYFMLGPGGERFKGSFLLVDRTSSEVFFEPIYQLWSGGDYKQWNTGDQTNWFGSTWSLNTFARTYDGRIVVGFQGNRENWARCFLTLNDIKVGMPSGGRGECQVTDGSHLVVRF